MVTEVHRELVIHVVCWRDVPNSQRLSWRTGVLEGSLDSKRHPRNLIFGGL